MPTCGHPNRPALLNLLTRTRDCPHGPGPHEQRAPLHDHAFSPEQPLLAHHLPGDPGSARRDRRGRVAAGSRRRPHGRPARLLARRDIPFLAIGLVLWFLIFAPEKKARKKRQAMLDAIKKGDQVVTTSGLHAEVVAIRDHEVDLMAGSSRFTYSRAAVNEILD